MVNVKDLWSRLPSFAGSNRTVRAEIKSSSADMDAYGNEVPWREESIDKANMITSAVKSLSNAEVHIPVLDIDFEAQLLPSSTPGHYHLFLDRVMTWPAYENLLRALAEANIIQWGFYEGAKKRKATSVRLPWIKKGDVKANALEPDKEEKRLKDGIEFHEAILKRLRSKLMQEQQASIFNAPLEQSKVSAGDIYVDDDGKMNVVKPLDKDVEW